MRVQLLVAYGGDVGEMEDHTALLEVSAFSLFLELDNAVSALLTQCNALGVDLDRPLSQGALPTHISPPSASLAADLYALNTLPCTSSYDM